MDGTMSECVTAPDDFTSWPSALTPLLPSCPTAIYDNEPGVALRRYVDDRGSLTAQGPPHPGGELSDPMTSGPDPVVVVMGVAGSGKSSVGSLVAQRLGVALVDADGLHTADAVAGMRRGHALSIDERDRWISRVVDAAAGRRPCVVACSALLLEHRDRLRALGHVRVVHLDVPESLLRQRLRDRADHFFPESLLDDQLAVLESPTAAEPVATVDAARPLAAVVTEVVALIGDIDR